MIFVITGRSTIHFNSHAHEGRDGLLDGKTVGINISTHTPTRGVTTAGVAALNGIADFNSHAHEGVTTESLKELLYMMISTHTPTRGVT